MAAGGDWTLQDKDIVKLAAVIAAKDMKTIAEGYMDIASETVKNKLYENLGDVEAFNREIIRHWANKHSGPEQIKVILHYNQSSINRCVWGVNMNLRMGYCKQIFMMKT